MKVIPALAFVGLSVLLLSPSQPLADDAPGAGVVVAAQGEVSVRRQQGAQPATAGFALQPGDSLVIKQGARCRGFSPVGEPFDRVGPALVVFARASEENFRSRVSRWVAQQLAQWAGQSRNRPLITRSVRDWQTAASVAAPIIPAADGCVRSSRPFLCWKTHAGIQEYTVTIASEDGAESSSTVRGHEFSPSDLVPGRKYAWRVEAEVGGGRIASAWRDFRVLAPEEEELLDSSLQDLSDLMAGILLLAMGLHDEAIGRLDAAVATADQPTAALRWRAQALAAIGLHDEAYTDILRALDEASIR